MDWIILGIGLVVVLGIIAFLFTKLTPNNIPKSLSGFYFRIVAIAVGAAVLAFTILGLINHFFG